MSMGALLESETGRKKITQTLLTTARVANTVFLMPMKDIFCAPGENGLQQKKIFLFPKRSEFPTAIAYRYWRENALIATCNWSARKLAMTKAGDVLIARFLFLIAFGIRGYCSLVYPLRPRCARPPIPEGEARDKLYKNRYSRSSTVSVNCLMRPAN